MAIGDRVVVGDGYTWTGEVTVVVYGPVMDAQGNIQNDYYGAATLQRLGGVKGGSTGTIAGQPLKVHRIQLVGEQNVPSIGGVELVNVFPVKFDYYQRTAFVPASHVRILGGDLAMDRKPPQT